MNTLTQYKIPEGPCPDGPHGDQKIEGPGVFKIGCSKCDQGWDYLGGLQDNLFDQLLFLQSVLGKKKKGEPDVVIEGLDTHIEV